MSASIDVVERLHTLPDELVSKIMWYVPGWKSRHVDLEVGYLKKMVGGFIFDKFVEGEGLVVENGHVTELCLWGRNIPVGRGRAVGMGLVEGGNGYSITTTYVKSDSTYSS